MAMNPVPVAACMIAASVRSRAGLAGPNSGSMSIVGIIERNWVKTSPLAIEPSLARPGARRRRLLD